MIDQTVYWNDLYDHYGALLTDKQRDIFVNYYVDDLTFQEIADNNGTSKNAVHKTLTAIIEKLENYEKNLNYHKKIQRIKEEIKDEKVLERILEIL